METTAVKKYGRTPWQVMLAEAIQAMMAEMVDRGVVPAEHVAETPRRVVDTFVELFSGVDQKPEEVLCTDFIEEQYSQMVTVRNIPFVSCCSHHLLSFIGTADFAYIPDGRIVGFSKIPRLIEMFARRPQVQERLAEDIVTSFMRIVRPKGCAVLLEAVHLCMCIRGIKVSGAITRTTALRGVFADDAGAKMEFISGCKGLGGTEWLR